MSWESSVEYERIINTEVRRRLGGVHSAELIVRSYDFARIEALQSGGRWREAGDLLAGDARALEVAGAGCVLLCTNTMHVVAEAVEAAITVPFLHLADATGRAAAAAGVRTVGLIGTRYTMEQNFYRSRLERAHGLTVLVPEEADRGVVHDVIYDELVRGVVDPASRARYVEVIGRLSDAGAAGIVAGCTEIELLVGPDDVDVTWFPSTRLHALAAVDWALADGA